MAFAFRTAGILFSDSCGTTKPPAFQIVRFPEQESEITHSYAGNSALLPVVAKSGMWASRRAFRRVVCQGGESIGKMRSAAFIRWIPL
jgi:hypothetical protein